MFGCVCVRARARAGACVRVSVRTHVRVRDRQKRERCFLNRLYFIQSALKTLICAFVLSRIDYCNSHLARCTKKSICKLQKLQSSAARLICRSAGSAHTSPCSALASCRIPHNHSTKCFFLSTTSLSDLIQLYLIFCHLRSSASVCSPASGRRA